MAKFMEAEQLKDVVAGLESDVYLFNSEIRRGFDLRCLQQIAAKKSRKSAILILVSNGGDPDAAFKIARYFQHSYERFSVLVSGLCKSAGTLIALGAHELVFMPYGELGPLDIQMSRIDKFEQMQSGLVISDSLTTLEERALAVYDQTSSELLQGNRGMISFASASAAAVEVMKAIYSPVLARIDPEEIGVRARAMRIAQDYGKRLDAAGQNLNDETLTLLSEKYPSHSFVIDHIEAASLFKNVRLANEQERILVDLLGPAARFQGGEPLFHALHEARPEGANDDRRDEARAGPPDGGNPEGADAAPDPAAEHGVDENAVPAAE